MTAAARLAPGPRVDSSGALPQAFAVILGGGPRASSTPTSPDIRRTGAVENSGNREESRGTKREEGRGVDWVVAADSLHEEGTMRYSDPCRRKGSRSWYSRTRDPRTGRRSWRSTGTTVLRAARAIVRRWEIEEAELGVQALAHEPTVAESLERWLEREASRLSPLTWVRLEGVARRCRKAWGSMALSELTAAMLDTYLGERRRSCAATTVNLERRILLWWLADVCRRGELRTHPGKATERYPEEIHDIRVLRGTDRERLEAALECEPWDVRLAVVLAVETGLRQRAILALRWEWIDTENGWISLPGSALKSRRALRIPLSAAALAAVHKEQAAVLGLVFTRSARDFRRHWRRIVTRAGLRGLHFHDLRKTFLTDQCRRGTRLEVAMALSDHRDLRTVLKCYRAIAPEELLRAVGRDGASVDCGIG